jgi:NDP-sugar pyrophosphorylase family protein
MRAMILAAGLGTRLRPLTEILPKPAVPYFDRPIAAHALAQLAEVGVTDVVLNAHHLAERLEPALRPFVPSGMRIEVIHEPTLLGTGGGVRNALLRQSERLGPPADDELILLMNGDVVFFPDLRAALEHHRRHRALATMVVRRDPRANELGAIDVAEGRVERVLGRPPSSALAEPMMFTGVHVLSGRALNALPEEGCIVRKGYIPWLMAGESVAAHVEDAPFRDCGTLAEYLAAHLDGFSGRVRVDTACAVAADASVAGALLDRCAVGSRASIDAGVRLARCVVWPGEHVRVSATDAVFAGGQMVQLPRSQ